ncbi:MAG TPA: PIN domain-containing protein [Anaerolineales bacterium]|nr:PIN domain-containing protein [Anaerolineales bacterium]
MTFLDTHVVVWLYAGLVERFNAVIRNLLNETDILVSPVTRLELQYLYEIQRITDEPDVILRDLADRIGLKVSEASFNAVIGGALRIDWTRDPFDRIIVAEAGLNGSVLVTKDQTILAHYLHARW